MVTDNLDKIRRQFDEKADKWYYSVVDVIGALTKSSDARNYWKVLKNRLKKEQNELVTNLPANSGVGINQLKLSSRDGKSYLTDVADTETVLKLLEILSPGNISPFKSYFEDFLSQPPTLARTVLASLDGEEALGHSLAGEAKLLLDAFETDTEIIVRAMVAGVSLGDLFILPAKNKITIRGKRLPAENIKSKDSPAVNSRTSSIFEKD